EGLHCGDDLSRGAGDEVRHRGLHLGACSMAAGTRTRPLRSGGGSGARWAGERHEQGQSSDRVPEHGSHLYPPQSAAQTRQADFRSWFINGSERMRLPVAAKIALSTAGAATQIVGSPTPPQKSPDGMMTTSTLGISSMRITLYMSRFVCSSGSQLTVHSPYSIAERP